MPRDPQLERDLFPHALCCGTFLVTKMVYYAKITLLFTVLCCLPTITVVFVVKF